MKKQIAGLLTGLLVCSAFLTGCGKNEATEAVKESVEDENEGTGDTKDADSKKDTNRKSDKQDSDKSDENSEESETTEEPEEDLDKVGVLLPEEGEDINSSLERTELKSRLEEAGYEAAMYFAGDDSDTQAEQIRELLQDEKLKALVISPVDPYGLTDVLEEASELSIPVIDYDNLIMDTPNVKYFVTFNMRAIGKEIAKNIVEKEELDKVREDRGVRTIEFLMGSPDDDDSLFLFNGIMEVLQEYIDDGTLICRSGRVTFDETSIMDQNTDTAKKQLKSEIDEFYSLEKTPDIICTASDDFALAALEFLEKENHKAAFTHGKKELVWVKRFLKPKKLRVKLHFGFEDPYHTGQVLALCGMLYAFVGENMDLEPDFEKRVLEGSVYVKGRLRTVHMAVFAAKMLLDKNIRSTYHDIREFKW